MEKKRERSLRYSWTSLLNQVSDDRILYEIEVSKILHPGLKGYHGLIAVYNILYEYSDIQYSSSSIDPDSLESDISSPSNTELYKGLLEHLVNGPQVPFKIYLENLDASQGPNKTGRQMRVSKTTIRRSRKR